jgi:hypothetical protein
MIAISILDNSITHAHIYVIVILCVSVATHGIYLVSYYIQLMCISYSIQFANVAKK